MVKSVPRPSNVRINKFSIFALRYNIPSITSNPLAWEGAWDKVLRSLSPADDIYPIWNRVWQKGHHRELSEFAQKLAGKLPEKQEKLVNLWVKMEKMGHFVGSWLLLDEKERKRHLLKGMEDACENSSWRYDTRALCPEITVRSMLKRGGLAFTSLIRDYSQGKKDEGVGNVYFLPSVWWQTAINVPDPNIETTFFIMTLQRNEFITTFLAHTTISVLQDIANGSSGMDPVLDVLEEGGPFMHCLLDAVARLRAKPVIRCQNCTRTQKDIGCGAKFMLCSPCRSILDISVHYCSKNCQKEDWRKHKMHCGKRNGVKQIQVTSENGEGTSGSVHPSRTHSPALQRQLSLLDDDEDADYFLFDDMDQPIRFVIEDEWVKLAFRMYRSDATVLYPKLGDIEAIAEHLMKHMGEWPGLSRERILAQFDKEYGEGTAKVVLEFERRVQANGYGQGLTAVEVMGKGLASMPKMMKMIDPNSRWNSS